MDPQLEAWIQTHYRRLYEYACFACYNEKDDAADLLQEVLTQIAEGRIKVDLARSPLTFVQLVLHSRRRLLARPFMPGHDFSDTPEVEARESPSLDLVMSWVWELPQEQQEAVYYYCEHGTIPTGAVKLRYQLKKATRALKAKAQAHGVDGASGGQAGGGTYR